MPPRPACQKLPGRSPGKVLRLIMMRVGLRGMRTWKGAMIGRLVATRTVAMVLDGYGSRGVEAFGGASRA